MTKKERGDRSGFCCPVCKEERSIKQPLRMVLDGFGIPKFYCPLKTCGYNKEEK
jgi:hypothetical protein